MHIQPVTQIDDELYAAFERLMPQLSSAPLPTREHLQALIDSPACTLLVARDPEILGTLTLAVYPSPTGVHAWIEDVVVDTAARGRGIGEALTLAGIEVARQQGADEVNLTSRPSREAANRLYQKVGFMQRNTNVYRYSLK